MELQEVAEHLKHELVTCDEPAAWFAMFARYHTGKQGASDLPRGLSMHSAGGFSYHRKTGDRRRIVVPHAAVSVTGGIQPGVLARALTADFLDAGLAARPLMAMPPKRPKRWTEVEIDPDTKAAYQATLDRLLALGFDTGGGEKAPHVLPLAAEAKARWVAFYEHWAREQNTVEGELAAAYSKLEAYAARFALLHHVVTHAYLEADDRRPVGARSVEAGITLAGWFAREARRIYATFTESTEQREMRRLVEFIQARGGRITVRQLMRANCRRFPGAEAAELALAALVEADLARWVEPTTGMKGGLPIKGVELCMTHDTDDTEPPDDNQEEGDGGLGLYDIDPPGDNGPSAAMPQGEAAQPVPPSLPNGVIGVMRHAEVPDPKANGQAQGSAGSGEGALSRASVIPSRFRVMARGASPPPYQLVRDAAGLAMVRTALADTDQVGLDVETTGLDPRQHRVRLLSVSTDTIDGGRFAYLVDCFAVDPLPLFDMLADKELVLHHALFDLTFLARQGFVPASRVRDTMLLAQLLTAGTNERVNLAACCEHWLGLALDKAGQKSDWSGELTAEQLAYAATDVAVLVPLWEALDAEVRQADLGRAAEIEERCLPAVAWMARQGAPFDRETWFALARAADAEAERLRDELHQAAPPHPERGGAWNWDSPAQAKQALARVGCLVPDTTDETLATADHPLAQLLRRYRLARKRGGTYGADWLKHVAADGRVYAHWHPCGAKTGRMSSARPSLQNVPRAGAYRRCFRAPPGRVLVQADFSQIELRIAAKVTGDAPMMEAFRRGEDLHTLTAQRMTGQEQVSAAERQLAKPVNFGLIYGLGAASLRRKAQADYGLELSEADAARYRRAFFVAYPAVRRWHTRLRAERATETRTLAGRRVLVKADAFFGAKANYVVQGTGGDGIKRALALLWERRAEVPGAFPVLAVHDEIVVECGAGQAEAMAAWLKQAMVDAMAPLIDPVPVEVEVKGGRTWGGDFPAPHQGSAE